MSPPESDPDAQKPTSPWEGPPEPLSTSDGRRHATVLDWINENRGRRRVETILRNVAIAPWVQIRHLSAEQTQRLRDELAVTE